MARIAAVMTCFNRRDKTLACLASLERQRGHDAEITPYVVDDGSTDGTGQAVARQHPSAVLLQGDGSLFWGGGMRLALEHAFRGGYDYYLWLNDDIDLDDDAVARLLAASRSLEAEGQPAAIVVGSMRHPQTGQVTYGGRYRPSLRRRAHFVVMPPPTDHPQPTETFNGNLVLVPAAAAELVGNVDPAFRQQWGDQDYGLRARAAGATAWVAPGTFGACARNPEVVYGRAPLREELRNLTTLKQLPPGDWATFARRWMGPLWPVYWASPYLRRAVRIVQAHRRQPAAAA